MIAIPTLPEGISTFQITEIQLHPENLFLNIEFTDPVFPNSMCKLELHDLSYFAMSKSPEDHSGCYQILDLKIGIINDVESFFEKTNLDHWPESDEMGKEHYHLRIDGDIFLSALSKQLHLHK